ncbi:C-type lectin domain family 4 member F-like isoform X2 [Pelodiscus sinensis]|uniref:C-type lectin domain family 4 member F-like isoform X2 n=1 Tax=Pelodiscus sinensis TaxID=13735 RepID=UPI003F6AE409
MARENVYEKMEVSEAAPPLKGTLPERSVPWPQRTGRITPAVLLLVLALASSLLAVTLLYSQGRSRMQEVEEAAWTLRVSLQPTNTSAAPARESDKDVGTKLSAGWRGHGGNLYYFSQEEKSWLEAQQFCVSQGSHLTPVSSQGEQEFIIQETKRKPHWIGLTNLGNEGCWHWVDGSEYRADASSGY